MGSGDKFKEFSNNNSDIYNTDSKVGYPAKKKYHQQQLLGGVGTIVRNVLMIICLRYKTCDNQIQKAYKYS